MKQSKISYEESPYYSQVALPDKGLWLKYFRMLYDERDITHEKLTEESKARFLKETGLDYKQEDIQLCLNGGVQPWNDLLNGFFRHYYSTLYVEYIMALHNYAGLVDAQMMPCKDQNEIGKRTENLQRMPTVRRIIESLQSELFNARHKDLGNVIIAGKKESLFKDWVVEKNAKKRVRGENLRDLADNY